MRDILFAGLFASLFVAALRRPELGVYLWAWVSIMNPHTLTFGFARTIPWAMITALVAVLALLLKRVRKPFPTSPVTAIYIVLMLWMTVTSVTSINPSDAVWERWVFIVKIHLMVFVTLMTLRGRVQLEALVWVVVLSIAFYGVKGGVWTVLSGGGGRVWGPPGGMIAGNNEFAVAMVIIMPLMFYLYQVSARRWIRLMLGASMAVMAFAILGTQSRGALLSLLAMAFVLSLKGKYPVRTSLAVGTLVTIAIVFMPDTWSNRMETIGDFRDDTSAMSRLYTWKTLWAVALDRPLVGAGFAIDNIQLYNQYAPTDPEFANFRGAVWVAHSIYFQALGEHGFVGLGLFVLMGFLAYRMAGRLAVRTRDEPGFAEWVPLLMRMCQVAIVGYAVGGAFLSLMHMDVVYYIVALIVLADATVRESLGVRPREAARPSGRPHDPHRPIVTP